jgi:hypothetical protein
VAVGFVVLIIFARVPGQVIVANIVPQEVFKEAGAELGVNLAVPAAVKILHPRISIL